MRLLLAAALLSAPDDATWKELRSSDGNFLVWLPGDGKASTRAVDTEQGKLDVHMWLLERSDTHAYLVMYSDYKTVDDAERTLDRVRQGQLKDGARLIREKKRSMGRHPGRHLWMEQGDLRMESRIALAGVRLYQLIAVTHKDKPQPDMHAKVLDSFKQLDEDR